jgi:hypothetical protein
LLAALPLAGLALAAIPAAAAAGGCAGRVAQAYGEHPETAVVRMRWARAVIDGTP